jgi:NADPH-dependent 2,4-dienoyl-CoA reductase/sulfur reductase-like enzyme
MEENTDVLVIGGSASGIVAATTGKAFYPEKEFLLVRKERQVLVPCGIPYMFGSLESSDQNLIADAVLTNAGVRTKIDEVVSIDPGDKTCTTSDGTRIGFEKLVLALGSTPTVPGWLKGADLDNVYAIPKDKDYLDGIRARLDGCSTVVIIGGGFIGVEVGDELNKLGKAVTIVEVLPHVLEAAFDEEFAIKAEEILHSRGIVTRTGDGVKEIVGNGQATGVLLSGGDQIDAGSVILAMGYRPNTGLAERSGLPVNGKGFIKVDEYMRTDNLDIFAIGDCAEKKSFITRTSRNIMLASTACAEARVAALNLYKLSAVKTFGGTIAIYSTVIGDTAFGVAGVTESLAKERGFDIIVGSFKGIDKHPGTLPGTHEQVVKLIVARESGVVLGGQVMGGASTGELTNLLGVAIENRMTINSLLTAQVGTHPLLTAPPTAYPLIKAAEVAAKVRWLR